MISSLLDRFRSYLVHVRANCCSRHGSESRTTRSKVSGNSLIHDVNVLPVCNSRDYGHMYIFFDSRIIRVNTVGSMLTLKLECPF